MEENKNEMEIEDEKRSEYKRIIEDFNKEHNLPIDITDDITHDDFVVGVKAKKMGFKVLKGEPNTLLYGNRKLIFNIYVMFYIIIPLLAVPFLSYLEKNWLFLFGILFSYAFTFFATYSTAHLPIKFKWLKNIIIYYSLFCIGYWIKNGFHINDYITFFYFCSLWGTFWFKVAETAQNDFLIELLIQDSQLFHRAIIDEKIMIIKVREKEINK